MDWHWLNSNKDAIYFIGGLIVFLVGRFWPAFSVKITGMLLRIGGEKAVVDILTWVEDNCFKSDEIKQRTAAELLQTKYEQVTGQKMPDSIANTIVTTIWAKVKKRVTQ